ncbi:MAG: peptide chain release factor-like protein [Verrucomicrobia bacterium]|jgi:protein subunit release factor B|nr:peptide chain release factor-like protein [Verrucomicrobiota bacterium]
MRREGASDNCLEESELEETFSRSAGPGGQHVNKVSTRVTLKHLPTGLQVSVQEGRSQAANRQRARELLSELIVQREETRRQALKQEREKKRRQRGIRPPKVKRRILESKRKRSETKARRRKSFSKDD